MSMKYESSDRPRPNILVVMADGWRRQALGCAGADPVSTPHCDALAAQGVSRGRVDVIWGRTYGDNPDALQLAVLEGSGRY